MSRTKFVNYNGETLEEIIEKNKDADIITFSTSIGFTVSTDYKLYPKNDLKTFRKWRWYEGEYHFEGKSNDIPSLTRIKHIEILRYLNRSMDEWETTVVRMNN